MAWPFWVVHLSVTLVSNYSSNVDSEGGKYADK